MPFPLDIQYARELESALGGRLPASYLEAMCRHNGGEVQAAGDTWTLHPIRDASSKKRLKRTCNDVVYETKVMRNWPDFPQHAIAIAYNGSGDGLVFVRGGPEADFEPAIYHWDHETGDLARAAEDFGRLLIGRGR